jgi:hypothetical protein
MAGAAGRDYLFGTVAIVLSSADIRCAIIGRRAGAGAVTCLGRSAAV